MRSIHKKTLKRFLSTLLALTMVLGMVPFTALAAPVTDSVTLTQGNLTAKVSPHNVYFSAANKGANAQYGLRVDITASDAVTVTNVVFAINGSTTPRGLATELVANASGEFTTVTNFSGSNKGFEGYQQSTDQETLTYYIKVLPDATDALTPGYHEVTVRLNSSAGDTSGTIGFTIPQNAQVTDLTFSNDNPAVGETFTVYADTDISSGTVKFTYGTQVVPVNIVSMGDGNGRAYYTFTATTVRSVKAEIVDFPSGAVSCTASTETASLTALPAAPAYSYTVSYSAGTSVIASNIPEDATVTGNAASINYMLPTAVPLREGYTFAGWSTDGTETGKITTTNIDVSDNITLTALWTKNTVTVHYPASDPTGADVSSNGDVTVPEGSTVTFKVTVTDGYDVSTMVVTAGGVALAPVATGTANVYQFSFVANADTLIYVSPLQLTPVYRTITFLPGAVDAYIPFSPTTVSVKQGDSYPLPAAIPTREGYTFKGWDSDGNGTADYVYDSNTDAFTPAAVPVGATDVTLNAVWEVQKVTITWPTSLPTGVTANSGASIAEVNKGSTVYFTLTVAAGYDPNTLVVKANDQPLAPVKAATDLYQYSFVANADTTVTITAPSKLTYTVMMPVGHFTAKLTTANGAAVAAPGASASVEYGKGYTFTVTPASGYEIKGVYVNGAQKTAETDGSYKVENVTSAQTVEVLVDEIPSYTVTFTVPLTGQTFTQTVTRGEKATKPVVDPEREGYTFGGWYTGDQYNATGGTAFAFTSTAITADTILYGKLNPASYTIKYDANGGTGAPGNQDKTHGLAITLQTGVPTWAGHTFLGWSTNQKAETPTYQPGDAYSGDANITLYAVWKIDTFTVTLPNGTGYTAMPATGSSSPVNYGGSFTFTVTVDPEYAKTAPTVKVNGSELGAASSSGNTYTYTISDIQGDKVVSVSVTKNPVYTVTFMVNGSVYQTQQVEHGAKATVPNPPSVEGYTFGGWYSDTGFATAFNFADPITGPTTVYGKMTAITPKVTWMASGTGWSMAVTESTPTGLTNGGTVTYKSDVKFTVTISTGYDATNLAVAANGLALAPVEVNGNTYKFVLPNITEDQNITVTGVVRKMITITYNDNGGIGGPGQEQVKYYLNPAPAGDPNSTISTVKPTRVGYEFQGWATTNNATTVDYAAGATADFTTDTTLYAVWSAKTTTVTLTVDKTSQYEVENVVLTATVTSGTGSDEVSVTSGSVQFYRSNNGGTAELVGTAKVSGGKAVLTIATSAYKRGEANTDSYTVKFIPDEGSGYSEATSSPAVTVTVLSTAISWKLNGEDIATGATGNPDANELTIKKSDGSTTDSMTAGQVYTLELPAIYALDDAGNTTPTALVVNKDYTVTWQFRNASGTWEDYTAAAGTDSVKILAEYSQYVFRAVVTPLTGATSHFTQAAKYTDAGALTADSYVASLVTKATNPVAQQDTTTTLAVTDTHDLTGGTAEFEGQKVTLTATVKLAGTDTKIGATGEVYFYNGATLIGKANVQTDGTAVLEATMSTYSASAKDTFKAVYQDNATYKTSTSDSKEVLIRSTAIAWAGSNALTVKNADNTADATSIIAGTTYTLNLPAVVEDGQSDVSMTVGTDYTVEWYEEAPDGTITKIGATETNTFAVTPATEKVQYYAQVLPKTGSNYTDAYQDGYKNFLTSDKTNESVKAPTVTTLTFGEVKTDTSKTPDFSQYEQKTITITAKVVEADLTTPTTAKTPEEVVKSGTVTFYVVTKSDGTYEKISTATVSDGLATVSYTLPEYDLADALSNIEYIFAVYTDTDNTYATSNTTSETTIGAKLTTDKIDKETEAVQILSTSISWKLDGSNKIVATPDANKLKVYTADDNGNKGTEVTDGKMTAGSSYVLELPAVYALDGAQAATTALTVNKDYKVTWQFREYGTSQWADYPNASAGNTVLITPDYSGYQFQAVVKPIYDNEALTGYKTAAAYGTGDVVNGKTDFLFTDPTEKTERQATTTALEITGADNEAANVVINGANNVFTADHWAQFEGQKVTLEATVKETSTGTPAVTTGYVNFYRYVATGDDELLNTTPVEVGANGVATFEVTISDYSTASGQTALTNVDRFYAVYLVNDTYDTSASVGNDGATPPVYNQPGDKDSVWIKSTAIQTPVIDSARTGKLNGTDATYTSYAYDLTDLLAGVEHTFTLRTGNAAADWSVVALDGRTVAAENYDIQWNVKTGDNTVTDDAVGGTFTTSNNKVGDEISVTLIAKNDMKVGATSKKAIIGTKQDVTVTVTASDEIASTHATDVYQLNEITLTATVAAKETDATVKPSGTVTFYYSVDNTNWVEIGTAALALDEVSGTKKATIVTDKLPVDLVNTLNKYKQEEVTITAVYAGDETFNKSGTATLGTNGKYEIVDTVNGDVTDATVTVYSSVVLVHAAEENKAVTTLTDGGIHITANGSLVANETDVALTLQQVYTLDHAIDLSKLVYGTDYTVEWQILKNASQYNQSGYYGNTEKWNGIGATGRSYTIGTVTQDAAYRAKITVTDTAPVQGSAQGVLQDDVDDMTTGRKVYYSNVLVVGAGQATVTTNITTSANTKFNEEGIVEGETVTIHALVAGASNVTPISNLSATITAKNVSGLTAGTQVFTDEVTTVNGYNAFTWDTTGVTPGYYTLTVKATSNNGYAPQTITRTLIVRDKTYTLTATNESKVYNGKAQGIDWSLTGVDIENTLAQKSVVVYYYKDGKLVEPTQAGTYNYELYLPASAYWTELTHVTGEFTITPRPVNVVDLIAQAKVYDGTTDINELEVILNDSTVDGNGVATGNNGIINGDSIYATGVMTIDEAEAGEQTLSVANVTLLGDDADNYVISGTGYTETINVQRSQVKGDIADSTFQYTGSNITVPADDIYLIDQAGNVLTPADYTVTYYYHNGDGVEKVTAMNKLGKYTVIARPEQTNYKGGASETVYVVSGTGVPGTLTTYTSALIDITNTVELYGAATGIQASATNDATITTIEYYVSGSFAAVADISTLDAGRYLVKVTASTGDTAYGIYTIVKANPALTLTAANQEYNSAPYAGTVSGTWNNEAFPTGTYFTYAGGTIQGVAYEAPTEVGTYIVTAHVPETENYTAHEISAQFVITPKALTITADDLARWQYGSYPDMVATFEGLATGGVAADTSLRDVQIQPEFIFNDLNGDGQPEYTNSALDQVGKDYPITVRNALARNYTVTYMAGIYAVNELDPKADLAIHGMIDNGTSTENIAYYGDQIQLYAYGNYKSNPANDGTGVYNPSSLLEWSLSTGAPATIDQDGLLTITGVGTFTVTLTRGSGTAAISTSIEIKALKQEVKVVVPELNTVYNAALQDYTTKKTMSAVNAKGVQVFEGNSRFVISGNTRTDVGSQIVTGKVADSIQSFQSETYGGLFTINDKEVTVAPVEQTKVYGTKEAYEAKDSVLTDKAYSETGVVGGKTALTTDGTNKLGVVASVSDLYENIDVSSTGYEILVAGPENMNYNVKYTTAAASATAKVTAKPLTFKTGVIDSDGRTSGYMKNNSLFYKDEGYAITGTSFNTAPNDRMYGEVNPVMDYLFDELIAGDSEADLKDILDWLVEYSDGTAHNINGDANVAFVDAHLTGHKSTTYLTGKSAYYIDGMLAADGVKNYTITVDANEATQNIYQRPVTLKLKDSQTELDVYIEDAKNDTILMNIIKQNLEVSGYTYGGVEYGGLAEKLGHTMGDLQLTIIHKTVDLSGDYIVHVKVGNPNYWLSNTASGNCGNPDPCTHTAETFEVKIHVTPDSIKVVYNEPNALGWTSASVVMHKMPEDQPVNLSADSKVYFAIYEDKGEGYDYSGETKIRSGWMNRASQTGVWTCTYSRLTAGNYRIFAIPVGDYTIINSGNVPVPAYPNP